MLRIRLSLTFLAAGLLIAAVAPAWAQQTPPIQGNAQQLIAILQNADAPLFDKAKACQALAVVGTKEAIPVLAGLLSHPELAHYARFGLEPMPDPAVDDVLRDAAGKLEGKLLAGVFCSMGVRRDAKAVALLAAKLGDADPVVAEAAAKALGRIATPEAIEALQKALTGSKELRPVVAGACLTAADLLLKQGDKAGSAALYDTLRKADIPKYLQSAAIEGAIRARGADGLPMLAELLRSDDSQLFRTALHVAQQIRGAEVAKLVMNELKLPEAVKVPENLLVIVKAQYGVGDQMVDVTSKVAAAVGSGQKVIASNALAGDPAPKMVKKLCVEYLLGGKKHMVEVAEQESLSLEGKGAMELAQYPRQTLLIYVLGDLGEKVALPTVLKAAESQAWDIRRAAVQVLGTLGDVSVVPVLLAIAVDEGTGLAETAQQSLVELDADGVDAALMTHLAESQGKHRAVVIDLLGQRNVTAAVPALIQAADDADQSVRKAAVLALGRTVGPDQLSVLINRLIHPKTAEAAAVAKQALSTACIRMPDRDAAAATFLAAMPQASVEGKVALLELLGVVGGPKALDGVVQAARSDNDDLKDAATRVLGEWMSADVASALLDLAKTESVNKYKIRALRGYIRCARQLDMEPAQRLEMSQQAIEVAQRADEKRLAIDVLSRVPSGAALKQALSYLPDPSLKEAASDAAVTIADKIVQHAPRQVADAMKQVIAATDNTDLSNRAKALLNQAERKLGGK